MSELNENENGTPITSSVFDDAIKKLERKSKIITIFVGIATVLWLMMLVYGPYRVYNVNTNKCLTNALLILLLSSFFPIPFGIFLIPIAIFWPKKFCTK